MSHHNQHHPLVWTIVALFALGLSTHVNAQGVPPPAIRFYVGDTAVDPATGVTVAQLPELKLRVVPDTADPDDVKYAVRWNLYVRTGSNLGPSQTGTTESLYPGVVTSAKPGDAITIEIQQLTRTDASGKKEKVELGSAMKYLSIGVQ